MSQDCWASHNRTLEGDLQPDPKRFPSGIKKLADYVSNNNNKKEKTKKLIL